MTFVICMGKVARHRHLLRARATRRLMTYCAVAVAVAAAIATRGHRLDVGTTYVLSRRCRDQHAGTTVSEDALADDLAILRSLSPLAAVLLRSCVPGTTGNRRERPTKKRSLFAAFASNRGELQGSEPATFHRGVRIDLTFLCRFRAPCGLFAVSIHRVCHRVRVHAIAASSRLSSASVERQHGPINRPAPWRRPDGAPPGRDRTRATT